MQQSYNSICFSKLAQKTISFYRAETLLVRNTHTALLCFSMKAQHETRGLYSILPIFYILYIYVRMLDLIDDLKYYVGFFLLYFDRIKELYSLSETLGSLIQQFHHIHIRVDI